ncbi:MAG: hypothetical protein ACRD2X_27815 [Vicinamibacteraceae bacterium]
MRFAIRSRFRTSGRTATPRARTTRSGPPSSRRGIQTSSRSSCRASRCGHDAPIYTVIESIIEKSGTPYFSFKDVDENKPTGSIKIRLETIHYFLKRYTEDLQRKKRAQEGLEEQIASYERQLRQQFLWEQACADLAARQPTESPAAGRRLLPMASMLPDSREATTAPASHAG